MELFITKVVTRTLGREQAAQFSHAWLPRAALVATIACDCGEVQRDDCWTPPAADDDGYAPLRATTGAVVQEVRALAGRAKTAEASGVARVAIPEEAVSAEADEVEVAVVQVKSAAVGGARREVCKRDAAACRKPVGGSLAAERPRTVEQAAALSDAFVSNLDGGERPHDHARTPPLSIPF